MRLYLNDISVSFGNNTILQNINMEVNTKDKVAIVGRNGSGKTTLLRVITGEQEIDMDFHHNTKDKIQKTGKFNIGYLRQIAFENESVSFEQEILKAYSDVLKVKEELSNLESMLESTSTSSTIEKYQDTLNRYDLMGGYTYQKEYNTAIKKFGFTEDDKKKKLNEFSGGQRTKIALIKLLLSKPDLLILDEPTNHLDITSIQWLEDYLASYPKAVVVVSHDRAFLDRFVNVVYEIERNKIKKYIGNYTDFHKIKELNYEKELKEYKARSEERDRLQALADRFRYKATKASMAQSKLKQIERMGEIEKPDSADTRVFSTNIKPRVESGNDVLVADNIEIGYDHTLTKLSFKLLKGNRIGVVGGNGLGKSTLLKSLVGKVPLIRGMLKWGTNVEIGYFDQQSATQNISNESILDNFLSEFPGETIQSARNELGAFCFTQDDVFKTLSDLSGGERVRLELCKILKRRPNLLILDEPTNHMDITGKEALEKLLESFEGTIIFVSHDRYFVNKIARDLIVFDGGLAKYLKDTRYLEYEQMGKESKPTPVNTSNQSKTPTTSPIEKTNDYFKNKERARNENKRKKLEAKINIIEEEIQTLKDSMTNPEIGCDYKKVMEIESIISTKNIELESLMEEWLMLENID